MYHHIDISLENLKALIGVFEPDHPDLAQEMESIAIVLIKCQAAFEGITLKAWKKNAEQCEQYR